tara:strand:+ start:120 stop:959 length:840 start_codon:yes stop_codon:yes gene_type:complete
MKKDTTINKFYLKDEVIIITGAAGLLGEMHAETILEAGGKAVLLDINQTVLESKVNKMKLIYGDQITGIYCDITNKEKLLNCREKVLQKYGAITGLINNAANDPKVGNESNNNLLTRFENFTYNSWNKDLEVGLTGAFLCSQVFGSYMAESNKGVIVNIASDLSVIAPDQSLYYVDGLPENEQPVKPISYSVVKTGLIGLTKYLATYWAKKNIRVNAISPGGIFNNQNKKFLERIEGKIPLQRMAKKDEYKGSLLYLLSDASSYLTGFNLVVDGGRSIW